MRGYKPGYFIAAKVIGRTSLILGVAGTAADLGTAIESAITVWKGDVQ